MVKTFGEAADFTAFNVVDGYIYRVAWAKTMQVEKTEDGQEKESSLCDYMLERYDYKPSMDLVLNDILASGEQASMEEIREISEGLGAEPLGYMKKAMLAYIEKYDVSSSVNSFLLNGMQVWLDKVTRMGLMNSTTIAKAAGLDETTLWLGDIELVVDCDKAIQLLSALEIYALECFNVTASHKAAVNKLDNIDAVLTYDYREGYPEKLNMEVQAGG